MAYFRYSEGGRRSLRPEGRAWRREWVMRCALVMRDKLVCPRCGHNHILLISEIPDSTECGLDPNSLKIAFVAVPKKFLSSQTVERAGQLEAAVCRQCGYTELYTRDPQAIPIDGKFVREGVGPEPTHR
jgi:predicted nucleic-acid-binding Zn-ribbon protein